MRLIFITLLLAFAASVSAQTLPITVEKGFLGPVFRYDNLTVQGYNFRNAMREDPEALRVLSGSGAMEIGAGTLAAMGAIFILDGAFRQDDPRENLFATSGTAYGIGVATYAAGIGLQILVNGKRKRAVAVYNKNLGFDEPLGFRNREKADISFSGNGVSLSF